MAHIEITYDGKRAYTAVLAAKAHGKSRAAMLKVLARLGIEPLPEGLDERTPLYDAYRVDAAVAEMPGRGAHFRKDGSAPMPTSDPS